MEDLVLSCLESRVEENRNLYARFLVGPFLKGDALTVATALRRILLSSIESIGVTALYIQGITHEFSTIVGVRESVLELSLNFQAIVLSYDKTFFQKKSFFDDLQIGYLQVQGPKVIYANHLKLPLGVKLVDPTQYIATVSKEGSIVLKFIIGKKRAFLHQNTGPESFFGNPARDLPITGKVSKKNIGRAKKTCFYKKGSTIDWLPIKLSGHNVQNTLERQTTAFDPHLIAKQRRSFINAGFCYKSLICMENFVEPAKSTEGLELFVRKGLGSGALSPSGLGFLNFSEKKSGFAKRARAYVPLQIVNLMPRRGVQIVDLLELASQTRLTSTNLREQSGYKLKICMSPYKSTICTPLRGIKSTICKGTYVRRFVRARTSERFPPRIAIEKPFCIPLPYKSLICTCLGSPRKFYLHKKKGHFAIRFFRKQKPQKGFKLFTNGTPSGSHFSYKSPIWTCTSPLLKRNMALLIKKDKVVKEEDVKKKKVLFFKNNDNVFKSNICLRNVIPLDFSTTPVLKVNFVVEIDDEVLYLRQKVRERIILEVWTNGSIHPRQAVHDAALSLTDIFASFKSVYGAKS